MEDSAGKLKLMNRPCPRCRGPVESTSHGGLWTNRCCDCGWEESGTANSPRWFQGMAVEIEREFWVKVSIPVPVAPEQLRAVRAVDPSAAGESVQAFVTRVKCDSQLRLGPFFLRDRAIAALQALAAAGLDATLDI